MKIYRGTTEAVIRALEMIFLERRYADKVIEKVLKQNPKWGARDRKFIAETTYDIVRWYRLLKETVNGDDRDLWAITGGYLMLRDIPLPQWPEFAALDSKRIREAHDSALNVRSVRESIPDWMDEIGVLELGERWERELHALNEEAEVVLRVNTIKVSREELEARLKEDDVETSRPEGFPDALVLGQRQNVFRLKAFTDGWFEVQDAASQTIAPFLQVTSGMRVVDACAGAGGKTLHLAALMENKGRLVALDVDPVKLDELQRRARRAGVTNLETRPITGSKVIKRLEESADRLLLDVPCSGLGVLRRNPDAKWKLSPEFLDQVRTLQQKILTDYSKIVKPNGLLVYATCSILPSENEHQVATFIRNHGDRFQLVDEKRRWPSEGYDGFYMALIKRAASTPDS